MSALDWTATILILVAIAGLLAAIGGAFPLGRPRHQPVPTTDELEPVIPLAELAPRPVLPEWVNDPTDYGDEFAAMVDHLDDVKQRAARIERHHQHRRSQ